MTPPRVGARTCEKNICPPGIKYFTYSFYFIFIYFFNMFFIFLNFFLLSYQGENTEKGLVAAQKIMQKAECIYLKHLSCLDNGMTA